MKILVISCSGEVGATLRTAETATDVMKKNAQIVGHQLYTREDVTDKLVDQTYADAREAGNSAEFAGLNSVTSQKLQYLAMMKKIQ